MRNIQASVLVAGILVAVACNSPAGNFPPNTDDTTCGASEVHCLEQQGDQLVRTGYCCWTGSQCGGAWPNIGCPAGYCCEAPESGRS